MSRKEVTLQLSMVVRSHEGSICDAGETGLPGLTRNCFRIAVARTLHT